MKIGSFDLEKDGTYIIAEMSANHNGSLKTALDTIKSAKECGANAIKLQTYTADTITLNSKKDDFIIDGGTLWDGKNLYELYKEAYTPWEWHKELFEYARSIDIDIFSSPFDKSAVDFLEQFNPSAYKIASFEITDYELIKYAASKMKPMIISTGIAYDSEIQDAVDICRSVGNNYIILLKCTSAYPALLEDANLLTIPEISKKFDVVAGFSDHTIGSTAPIVAVALGANVIEKHFIIDKSIGGADAEFSMNVEEFKKMVDKIRDTEKLLGIVDFSMNKTKEKNRRFSRSIYVSKDIKKGETFTNKNLKSVRPSYGMHPKYLDEVLGSVATKNYEFGDRFNSLNQENKNNSKNIVIATLKEWNISKYFELENSFKEFHFHLIRDKDSLSKETIDSLNPKYIFFPHWSWIIPRNIYENYNCVVFHMTDLPFGRGGSPLQNLIIQEIYNTKISALKVCENLDSGDIYMKEDVNISKGSAEENFIKIANIIFTKMIPKFLISDLQASKQEGKVTLFKRREPKQSDILKLENLSISKIYDFIRMLDAQSYPRAYIKLDKMTMKFSDVVITDNKLTGKFEVIEDE